MIYIYALQDPNTLEIKYVGQSANSRTRLFAHLYDFSKSQKTEWISRLNRSGKKPTIILLERVDASLADARENYWMAVFKLAKNTLTNIRCNGESSEATGRPRMLTATISADTFNTVRSIANCKSVSLSSVARQAIVEFVSKRGP